MALTIRNITDEQIEQAKQETGKGTGSAALVELIELSASRRRVIDSQAKEIRELREKLAHANRVMERLASAADDALCIVRQKELLQ